MESNTDKEMRDKLRGVEYPFDPKAWQQMDTMLEKDRKPKAFIWWWTGGIAAALIIGAGLFGYNQFTNLGTTLVSNTNSEKTTGANTVSNSTTTPKGFQTLSGLNNKSNTAARAVNEAPSAPAPSKIKRETLHKTVSSVSSLVADARDKKSTENLSVPAKTNKIVAPSFNYSSAAKHSEKTNKQSNKPASAGITELQQANESGIPGSRHGKNPESASDKNAPANNESVTASAITVPPPSAADLMLSMKPDALATGDALAQDDMKKKDDDGVDLKKLKKKAAFNYSLGVAANITGSTLGTQGSANIFTKKPSYMVGLTQDFMFAKRVAVTTGFMFAQTSYSASDFNYTCSITELNIPIGLKAYLVSKSKVRLYLDAGIINHIKLKETFTPIYNDQYANLSGSSPGYSFGPIPNTLGISTVNTNSSGSNAEAPYSINNGKHYYASFYTGAGVEFIVKSHLVFFTEPMFSMTLEKILAPDRYKYDLGLSGGFRYQF